MTNAAEHLISRCDTFAILRRSTRRTRKSRYSRDCDRLGDEELKTALERVDALERDHREADALHRQVDELGTLWLGAEELSSGDFAQFRDAVARLAEIYPQHIQVEDQVLFPAAERALSSEQKAEIAKEMAGRRSVKLTNL